MQSAEVQAFVEAAVQARVDAAVDAAVASVRAEFNVGSLTADKKTASTVDAVAVKVTSFNPDDPEVWFIQLEDQFSTKGITVQKTMYEYVTSNLDRKTAGEMHGFLKQKPKINPYDTIKAYMVKRYGKTQLQKDNILLSMTSLGDLTPSEAWERVKSLNSNPETFMRAWFLNLIPANTRSLLGRRATTGTVEDMCEEADLILEQSKQKSGVAAIASGAHDEQTHVELEVDAVGRGPPRPGCSPRGDRQGQRQPQGGAAAKGTSFVCHYHTKFGQKAFSCKEGCTFADLPLAQRSQGNANAGR